MSSPHKIYAREVYENLKYRPTWLPGIRLQPGAIGILDEGVFRQYSTLNNLGIHSEFEQSKTKNTIKYASKGAVSYSFKAAGESNQKFSALAKASAGILIEFSREGAVVLQLGGVSYARLRT